MKWPLSRSNSMTMSDDNPKLNIFVTVELFQNIVSKKWLFLAKDQQIKEVWKFKVEIDSSKDNSGNLTQIREHLRKMQVQISKESLKNFEHLSEGMGNDFKISYEII